jgi:hypothetical protein
VVEGTGIDIREEKNKNTKCTDSLHDNEKKPVIAKLLSRFGVTVLHADYADLNADFAVFKIQTV